MYIFNTILKTKILPIKPQNNFWVSPNKTHYVFDLKQHRMLFCVWYQSTARAIRNLAVVKLISYSCAAGFSRSTRVTCRSLPRCLCRGWVPVKFDQFRFRLSIQIPTWLKDEVKHLDKHIYSVSFCKTICCRCIQSTKISRLHKNWTL